MITRVEATLYLSSYIWDQEDRIKSPLYQHLPCTQAFVLQTNANLVLHGFNAQV